MEDGGAEGSSTVDAGLAFERGFVAGWGCDSPRMKECSCPNTLRRKADRTTPCHTTSQHELYYIQLVTPFGAPDREDAGLHHIGRLEGMAIQQVSVSGRGKPLIFDSAADLLGFGTVGEVFRVRTAGPDAGGAAPTVCRPILALFRGG